MYWAAGTGTGAGASGVVSRTNLSIRTHTTISITSRTGQARSSGSSGAGSTVMAQTSGAGSAGGTGDAMMFMASGMMSMTSGMISGSGAGSSSGLRAQSGLDRLRLAVEAVDSLATSRKSSTLSFEFAEAHGRESRNIVNDGLLMMNLVNGDRSVDNGGLNDLLLQDGLDGLVNYFDAVIRRVSARSIEGYIP